MNEIHRRTALSALGLAGIAAAAKAGPLNPPAGSVAPTGRTNQEIFDAVGSAQSTLIADGRRGWTPVSAATTPGAAGIARFRITQPGAYYLTQPIDAGTEVAAISVEAPEVVLDLNGFAVSASSTNTRCAISLPASGPHPRVIQNGFIVATAGAVGVRVVGTSGNSGQITLQDLVVRGSFGSDGVNANSATGLMVRRCRFWAVQGTAGVAINAPLCSLLSVQDVTIGGDFVIWAGGIANGSTQGTIIRRCDLGNVFTANAIVTGDYALVESCAVSFGGIVVGNTSTVIDSVASGSPGVGIDAGQQALIERCRTSNNSTGGIRVGANSVVRGCHAENHPTSPQFGIKCLGGNVQVIDNAIGRCSIGVDCQGVVGCIVLRNTLRLCPNGIGVSQGGNWYPFVDFSTLNTCTNPYANIFTNT